MTEGPRDLARYLPLSARPRVDESRVTSDWGPRFAELLTAIDALIASVPAATHARPEVRASRDRLTRAITAIPSGRRVRIAALGTVLAEAYAFAALTGVPLVVDPVTSGAVALDRALRAPHAVKAVIRNRTLTATDAEWSFGSGPEIAGTASELMLFLDGRAGVPGS